MRNFREHSRFPYYCQHCGLVEANTAKSPPNVPSCPKCENTNIDPYGKPPASSVFDIERPALLAGWGSVNYKGNLCPSCKQMTLEFHAARLLYD